MVTIKSGLAILATLIVINVILFTSTKTTELGGKDLSHAYSKGMEHQPKDSILDVFKEKPPAYQLLSPQEGSNVINLFLSSTIEAPDDYNELVVILGQLTPDSKLVVYLNGYGGNIAGLTRLLSALDSTKANVSYVVDGDVFSAHAVLACLADKSEIRPGSTLMFHSYSSSAQIDKGSDAIKYHIATMSSLKILLKARCSNYLTDSEINSIADGVDIYKQF